VLLHFRNAILWIATALVLLFCSRAIAEESLYVRHFEVPVPKKEAPKLTAIVLPEEKAMREIPTEKLLLPIEADPYEALEPDPVE